VTVPASAWKASIWFGVTDVNTKDEEKGAGEEEFVNCTDFLKVITKFGSEAITDELLERITKLTAHRKPLHSFLKKEKFSSLIGI